MKEILTNQYDDVSGGWADQDGSGRKSADNGGSRSGGNSGNRSGSSSLLDTAISAYHNNPYGSGASANEFFGGTNGSGSKGSTWGDRDHFGTNR